MKIILESFTTRVRVTDIPESSLKVFEIDTDPHIPCYKQQCDVTIMMVYDVSEGMWKSADIVEDWVPRHLTDAEFKHCVDYLKENGFFEENGE